MKNILIALITVTSTLTPIFSHACDIKKPGAPRTSQDIEQDFLKGIAGKSLSCQSNETTFQARIDIIAKYRCINSPIYGVLQNISTSEAPLKIQNITEQESVLTINTDDGSDPSIEPVICTVAE